ncbi:hypothetical protein ACX8XN_18500 [Calditrichota bacterium GD2]
MNKTLYVIKVLLLSIFKKNLVFIALKDEIVIKDEDQFLLSWYAYRPVLDEVFNIIHTSKSLIEEFKDHENGKRPDNAG